MSYDHERKAGNRGDVWKHFVLVSLVEAIASRDNFRYFESHAGAPIHQLKSGGEWKQGIGHVLGNRLIDRAHPYCTIAASFVRKQSYPAGWRFVADHLATKCSHVDVVLTDQAKAVFARYEASSPISPFKNVTVRFEQADGFSRMPHASQADLIFIDPPYHPNADLDWKAVGTACNKLNKDCSSFLAWYPIYWETKPQHLVDMTGCSSWEVRWAQDGPKPSQNLKGCGMLASADLSQISIQAGLPTLASCLGGRFQVRRPGVPPI
jgi:23S rRNA A2030 N6-methylase RlmJ